MSQPVAEWSDEQISRVIAEHLGWQWWTFLGNSFLCSPIDSQEFAAHPGLGWTQVRIKGREAKLEEHFIDSSRPYPRYRDHADYVNDPAMVLMLLEKLLERGIEVLFMREYANPDAPFTVDMEAEGIDPFKKWAQHSGKTIGKALALAYIQAHGLERR